MVDFHGFGTWFSSLVSQLIVLTILNFEFNFYSKETTVGQFSYRFTITANVYIIYAWSIEKF